MADSDVRWLTDDNELWTHTRVHFDEPTFHASLVAPGGVCPVNGVWDPAVFIRGWFSRTVR